jgi:NDP-sugar pyrophosphorylase family protein
VNPTASIQAAIVAGGLGTRLGAAAAGLPKPMLPVRGKPLLEHQLLWLKGQGFCEVTLCLGYKADVVREHFGDGGKWGMKLEYSVEKEPRGTAGCILDLKTDNDLLVVYGDLYIETELASLLDTHERNREFAATLGLIRSDHPQDSDLARMEGDRIVEIYRGGEGNLALAAVWLVRSDILKLIPADRPSDFGRDTFPEALRRGLELGGCVMKGRLADLGTPERFARFAGEP